MPAPPRLRRARIIGAFQPSCNGPQTPGSRRIPHRQGWNRSPAESPNGWAGWRAHCQAPTAQLAAASGEKFPMSSTTYARIRLLGSNRSTTQEVGENPVSTDGKKREFKKSCGRRFGSGSRFGSIRAGPGPERPQIHKRAGPARRGQERCHRGIGKHGGKNRFHESLYRDNRRCHHTDATGAMRRVGPNACAHFLTKNLPTLRTPSIWPDPVASSNVRLVEHRVRK